MCCSTYRAVIKSRVAGISPGYYECGTRLLLMENKKKIRTKRNPQVFDSPPTSCIYPATRNLNDNPDLAKVEQKLEFLNRTQTSLNFGFFIQWQQMNNFLFTCVYLDLLPLLTALISGTAGVIPKSKLFHGI